MLIEVLYNYSPKVMAARSSYLRVASVRWEISAQLGPYALVPTIVIAEGPGSMHKQIRVLFDNCEG
jgi:hypothetical protein